MRKLKPTTGIPNYVSSNAVTSSGPEPILNLFSSYFSLVRMSHFQNNTYPNIPFSHHTLPSNYIFSVDDDEAFIYDNLTQPERSRLVFSQK